MSNTVVNEDIELYKKFKSGKKKPKLKKLFELLHLSPNEFQKQVIKYIDEDYKNFHTLVFACARRSGKSTVAGLIAVLEMLVPNASVALVAPSSKQLNIIFDEVLKIVRQLKLPIEKLDTNSKVIKLENGSVFRGGSEKTVFTLEGISIGLLLIDEFFLLPDIKKILNSLTPALSTYGVYEDTKMSIGKIIMVGSVKANLEAKEYMDKGLRKEKGYVSFKFTALQNPLISKDFLDAERERLGEDGFAEAYLCEIPSLNNTIVFRNFNRDKNVKNLDFIKSLVDKHTTNIFGLDIGGTDKTSFLLIYHENKKYYVIDGFEISDSSERIIADNIKKLLNKYKIPLSSYSYIDPSAKLTRIGLTQDYNLSFYPALNNIKESVALLNDLFRQELLFIDEKMNFLVKQIETMQWKEGTRVTGDPFKRVKGHHFDSIASLRYGIFTHYKYNSNQEIVLL